jgi:hypothetical protein
LPAEGFPRRVSSLGTRAEVRATLQHVLPDGRWTAPDEVVVGRTNGNCRATYRIGPGDPVKEVRLEGREDPPDSWARDVLEVVGLTGWHAIDDVGPIDLQPAWKAALQDITHGEDLAYVLRAGSGVGARPLRLLEQAWAARNGGDPARGSALARRALAMRDLSRTQRAGGHMILSSCEKARLCLGGATVAAQHAADEYRVLGDRITAALCVGLVADALLESGDIEAARHAAAFAARLSPAAAGTSVLASAAQHEGDFAHARRLARTSALGIPQGAMRGIAHLEEAWISVDGGWPAAAARALRDARRALGLPARDDAGAVSTPDALGRQALTLLELLETWLTALRGADVAAVDWRRLARDAARITEPPLHRWARVLLAEASLAAGRGAQARRLIDELLASEHGPVQAAQWRWLQARCARASRQRAAEVQALRAATGAGVSTLPVRRAAARLAELRAGPPVVAVGRRASGRTPPTPAAEAQAILTCLRPCVRFPDADDDAAGLLDGALMSAALAAVHASEGPSHAAHESLARAVVLRDAAARNLARWAKERMREKACTVATAALLLDQKRAARPALEVVARAATARALHEMDLDTWADVALLAALAGDARLRKRLRTLMSWVERRARRERPPGATRTAARLEWVVERHERRARIWLWLGEPRRAAANASRLLAAFEVASAADRIVAMVPDVDHRGWVIARMRAMAAPASLSPAALVAAVGHARAAWLAHLRTFVVPHDQLAVMHLTLEWLAFEFTGRTEDARALAQAMPWLPTLGAQLLGTPDGA